MPDVIITSSTLRAAIRLRALDLAQNRTALASVNDALAEARSMHRNLKTLDSKQRPKLPRANEQFQVFHKQRGPVNRAVTYTHAFSIKVRDAGEARQILTMAGFSAEGRAWLHMQVNRLAGIVVQVLDDTLRVFISFTVDGEQAYDVPALINRADATLPWS